MVRLSAMDLIVSADGYAEWNKHRMPCALGRGGIRVDKQEGDGATPAGKWRMRALLFRPDRMVRAPLTGLPLRGLRPEDGWCDDPADPLYNRPVKLPFRARSETLWREDDIYDLIVVLGYNDDPPAPGKGSAVFLHIARPDFSPTEGCVAVSREDLLAIAAEAGTGSSAIVGSP
ncbi:MAG TPA: L,D-transpeptidase family protein [Stellaceae bacterium]|nr:L,D-transpeptidase family protein [Stellaceae bacterium]